MIPKKPALGPDPRVGTGFRRRSCSNKELKRDDDSKKSHPALGNSDLPGKAADDLAQPRLLDLLRGFGRGEPLDLALLLFGPLLVLALHLKGEHANFTFDHCPVTQALFICN